MILRKTQGCTKSSLSAHNISAWTWIACNAVFSSAVQQWCLCVVRQWRKSTKGSYHSTHTWSTTWSHLVWKLTVSRTVTEQELTWIRVPIQQSLRNTILWRGQYSFWKRLQQVRNTSKNEVGSCQDTTTEHRAAQGFSDNTQTKRYNKQEEKRQCISACIQNGDYPLILCHSSTEEQRESTYQQTRKQLPLLLDHGHLGTDNMLRMIRS